MKIRFDIKSIPESLLTKMPPPEELAKYKEAMTHVKEGDARPAVPEFGKYKPLEVIELAIIKAINTSYPSTLTQNVRNILKIRDTLDKQTKVNAESYDLEEKDVKFIQGCFARSTWPTDNAEFMRFIIMIQDAINQAVNKKGK